MRRTKLSSIPAISRVSITLALLTQFPAYGTSYDNQRLEEMQQQINELKKERMSSLPEQASPAPVMSFGGQYRINSYTSDNDVDTEVDNQTASRIRIRQNVDIKFDPQFDTHLQFELGHTTGNIGTTGRGTFNSDNPGSGEVRVRHTVLNYISTSDINLSAGILPLSDKFGDTLFSEIWDYNPLAIAGRIPLGNGRLRLVGGSLSEGNESLKDDDLVHYQADYSIPISAGELTLSGTWLQMPDLPAAPTGSYSHYNYGLALQYPFGNWKLDAFVLGSNTDRELLGSTNAGSGFAIKFAVNGKLAFGRAALMLTHASGKKDGSGFLPTMALPRTYGYWGYTGLLTVQGATDTGIDGDAINLSNNGYGLTTVQASYRFPIMPDLDGYIAAGWFGNTKAAGRDGVVGIDVLLMGTYSFNKVLGLDFGLAAANLNDSVSGYWQGAAGGFNQMPGVNRNRRAAFARLQAEF